MKRLWLALKIILLAAYLSNLTHAQTAASPPVFDLSSSLESRIVDPPDSVMKLLSNASGLARHSVTPDEKHQLVSAFAALPPLHRRILQQRVHSISFIEGIRNNGMTIAIGSTPNTLYDIVVRAGILHETVSEFLTRKEQTFFDASNSALNVTIEGGSMNAIVYVLLHEGTHVIDLSTRPSPDAAPMLAHTAAPDLLVKGIWVDSRTHAAAYNSPALDIAVFRTGKRLPIGDAQAAYEALAHTPFVSIYGSSNWYDDVAELVTWYHLSQRLKQPYRIILRDGDKTVFAYTPMTSPLVIERFATLESIYN